MKNLLLLGDSITKGQYVNPAFTWPELLRRDPQFTLLGTSIVVSAVSGETSTKSLDRLTVELHSFVPEYLFVQTGLNDANFWKTEGGLHPRTGLARFRENVREMIERAQLLGVSQVFLSTPHKVKKKLVFKNIAFTEVLHDYNSVLRQLSGEMGVPIFDLDRISEADFSERYLLPEPDLLHLSEAGHLWYFGHVRDFFVSNIQIAARASQETQSYKHNESWG